jgi:hypothetical protein
MTSTADRLPRAAACPWRPVGDPLLLWRAVQLFSAELRDAFRSLR